MLTFANLTGAKFTKSNIVLSSGIPRKSKTATETSTVAVHQTLTDHSPHNPCTQARMADSSACVRFFGGAKVAFDADGIR